MDIAVYDESESAAGIDANAIGKREARRFALAVFGVSKSRRSVPCQCRDLFGSQVDLADAGVAVSIHDERVIPIWMNIDVKGMSEARRCALGVMVAREVPCQRRDLFGSQVDLADAMVAAVRDECERAAGIDGDAFGFIEVCRGGIYACAGAVFSQRRDHFGSQVDLADAMVSGVRDNRVSAIRMDFDACGKIENRR